MTHAVDRVDLVRPGTTAVRQMISRLLGLLVPLTAPAWVHSAVQQSPALADWWEVAVGLGVGGSAAGLVAAGLGRVPVQVPAAALASAVGLALLTWPLAVVDTELTARELPWLWLILPLACAALASRGSVPLSLAYGCGVGTCYALIRLGDVGGSGSPTVAALEGLLLATFAVGLAVLVVAADQAAERLDTAATRSAEASARASRAAATDGTRRELDAVVHDTVLAALHAAVRPTSRHQVPVLAAEALARLEQADTADLLHERPVRCTELGERLRHRLAAVAPDAELVVAPFSDLPPATARAIADATVEAVRNARRHGGADGVVPQVRVDVGPPEPGTGTGTVRAVISDDGVGYDPAQVPPVRLGVAVSIVERMLRAGGEARVVTAPGRGTTVLLLWPAAAATGGQTTRGRVGGR